VAEPQFQAIGEEEVTEAADQTVLPDGVTAEPTGIQLFDQLEDGNLVDLLDDLTIGATGVATLTIQLFDAAKRSMKKWLESYKNALKLAKLEPESKKKTFPFEDASTVMMPFILETMLDFHSRTVPELVWAKKVISLKTYGKPNKEKDDRARRVSVYMNYQLSETIPFWKREQDKLLLALPCVGTGYKITYFNHDEQEARSDLYTGDQIVFDHAYKTFEEAPDKFLEEEYTRNEVITRIRGDAQWKLKEDVLPLQKDHPEPFKFLRAWTWIDLDDDGFTEPYEVVIYREDDSVVSVMPVYDEEEITVNEDGKIVDVHMSGIFTQYRFLPDPEGGPMGLGWGILLGDLFEAINTDVRQLIDAGTLANLAGNSGLIDAQMTGGSGRGNRQQSGPIEVRMGELTPITTGGKTLEASIVQFPYQGPNQALFELLKYMVEQIRTMANSAINMDVNAQEAAMMYLARLQQGLKVPNSIVMRVYDAAKDEFKKLAELNFRHHSDKKYNKVIDGDEEFSMRDDFNPDDCDVRLAVDPSQGSDVERQQRSQMVLEEAKTQTEQIINVRQAYLDWGDALGIADLEALMPEPDPNAKDPMQELMLANMQREAELADREMNIREQRLALDTQKETLRAMKEGAEVGLQFDKNEADISFVYAQTFYKLWEMGMAGADPIATVRDIEGRLIDKQIDLPPPPKPLPSPQPAQPEEGAPTQ